MEENKNYGNINFTKKQVEEKREGIKKNYQDLLFAKQEYERLLKLYDELLENMKDVVDKIVDEVSAVPNG